MGDELHARGAGEGAGAGSAPGGRPSVEVVPPPPPERAALYGTVIGPRQTAYYQEHFARFDAHGGAWDFTWNWSAFLFSVSWFCYRKLWGAAALVTGLSVAAGVVQTTSPMAGLALSVAVWIGATGAANWLYYRKVNAVLERATALHTDARLRERWMEEAGGTSFWGAFAATALILILCTVIMVTLVTSLLMMQMGGLPGGMPLPGY